MKINENQLKMKVNEILTKINLMKINELEKDISKKLNQNEHATNQWKSIRN